jgi:hypothetical protein
MKRIALRFFLCCCAVLLCSACISPNSDPAHRTALGEFGLTVVNSTGYLIKVNSAKYALMNRTPAGEVPMGDTTENYVEHSGLVPGDSVYIGRMSNNGWAMVVTVAAYDAKQKYVGHAQRFYERPMGVRLRPVWTVVEGDLHR